MYQTKLAAGEGPIGDRIVKSTAPFGIDIGRFFFISDKTFESDSIVRKVHK